MSRRVIRDVVIPVVERIMLRPEYCMRSRFDRRSIVRDPNLEEFLEEEMRGRFGVIGANGCQHLREQLEEAKRNDPYAFEFLIKELLNKYVKLATRIRQARKLKESEKAPPDRFSELRKKYPLHYR